MLIKLLKYDFKWINKVMLIYYIIAFSIAFLTRFVEKLEQTLIVTIIDKILVGTLISSFFSILITLLIRIWVRFRTGIYKDESYLTHTLPIKKSTIYNSKIISAYISIIIAFAVILACIFIVILDNEMVEYIKNIFNELAQIIEETRLIELIIYIILIVILEVIYMMQVGIFGIIIGNRCNNHKNLKSILIGIITYMFLSVISLAFLYLITIINPSLKEIYSTNIPRIETIEQLIYISLGIYLVYNLILHFTSKKILQKGVNVD